MAPPIFLPYIDTQDEALIFAATRLGKVLIPPSLAGLPSVQTNGYIILPVVDSSPTIDDIIGWLDAGADKVVVSRSILRSLQNAVPASRLVLQIDTDTEPDETESGKMSTEVSTVILKTSSSKPVLPSSWKQVCDVDLFVWHQSTTASSVALARGSQEASYPLVIPTSCLTLGETSSTSINIADAFLCSMISDRPDGLFPTIVSSYSQGGRSLGLVYSSKESVWESILTGKGVYQSRKHGLWRKGETSGATQDIVRISADCDTDCLEFSVIQRGPGFCHLNTQSCFGDVTGIAALEKTLQSRLKEAPQGSYTRRLFEDPALLHSKIMEEADELCQAEIKEAVAFEAADLIYFALTKCISKGVTIADIEQSLDKKAKKVTRRKGDAKAQWVMQPNESIHKPANPFTPSTSDAPTKPVIFEPPKPSDDDKIQMRTCDISTLSSSQRQALLRRPVLKSEDMIAKVKPIVDEVRMRGDVALKELTAKFDKAKLNDVVIRPPFSPESMALEPSLREAIDQAYRNIRAFHLAQAETEPLVVETMPGVVCTRFARPIARVGLYVPGGTAVLPSTALMLGVPAQVAGCKEIVIATPPRPDGSVIPEVMYVAHLVGASAVLLAGGGQAVAAMAYGTETVPKVDKILGPGNQWVTAAKMLVQNDTEALVAIDMPAGPSEVLVIADHTANPAFVASDLLSQAEHGIDSQVVLVAIDLSPSHLADIERQVDVQAKALPRVDITRESIRKSFIVKTKNLEEAMAFSNDYAPEHLILHIEKATETVSAVQNAGSVFVGAYSPESCGDYASGTNHTLPTYGFARQYSGINTVSFQKHITSQELTQDGLRKLGPVVIRLAECEGLEAHANAVRVRLQALSAQ